MKELPSADRHIMNRAVPACTMSVRILAVEVRIHQDWEGSPVRIHHVMGRDWKYHFIPLIGGRPQQLESVKKVIRRHGHLHWKSGEGLPIPSPLQQASLSSDHSWLSAPWLRPHAP